MPLVKGNEGRKGLPYLTRLQKQNMPLVYKAVNAVQATPWRINKRVLEIAEWAWNSKLEIGGLLPSQTEIPLPTKPDDIATNAEARKAYSKEAAETYAAEAERRGREARAKSIFSLAHQFKDASAIYFPMQLDFRGRVYPIPSDLTPQGDDLAKGLLTFARGKPLGESGLKWLAIHGANCEGVDKESLIVREVWADGLMHETIKQVAADPKGTVDRWSTADKPWQFLAFCFEYAEAWALKDPKQYVSHLPVSVDGTCNGMQHFSAMLRDEVGGKAVNLVPEEEVATDDEGFGLHPEDLEPQDLYQRVADQVGKQIEEDAYEGTEFAEEWLFCKIDRKLVKQAVMTLPYSATEWSMKEDIAEEVKKRGELPVVREDLYPGAQYFTKHVMMAIESNIPSAHKAMKWLKDIADIVTKQKKPLEWTSPLGFLVVQKEIKDKRKQIDIHLGGIGRYAPALRLYTDQLDMRRQKNGIAPNFIHSLDAAAMMNTVSMALDHGINNFQTIHDNFGVLAADMERMRDCIRQGFVDVHTEDVLEQWKHDVSKGLPRHVRARIEDLQTKPKQGNLTLEAVKDSVYFFS